MAERLRFRTFKPKDAKRLFEIYSNKEAMKFRGSKSMNSMTDAQLFVKNQRLNSSDHITIRKGIVLKSSDELIGSVMFRYWNKKENECEIGYSLDANFWGRGLGLETLKLLLSVLSLKTTINTVIAWSHKENIGSIKILEKNGFQLCEQQESKNLLYSFAYAR